MERLRPMSAAALNASIEQAIREGRHSRTSQDVCVRCREWCVAYHRLEGGVANGVLCERCTKAGGMHNKYSAIQPTKKV